MTYRKRGLSAEEFETQQVRHLPPRFALSAFHTATVTNPAQAAASLGRTSAGNVSTGDVGSLHAGSISAGNGSGNGSGNVSILNG